MAWTDIPQYIIDDIFGFQNANQMVDNFDFLKAGGVGTVYLANLAVTTGKIANLDVTTGKINTNAVTTAKILAANVTLAKLATDAKVVTGSYAGNNADDRAITGVGITSRFILIFGGARWHFKTDTMPATGSFMSAGYNTDYVTAIGADGFTVSYNPITLGPNATGTTYYYACLG